MRCPAAGEFQRSRGSDRSVPGVLTATGLPRLARIHPGRELQFESFQCGTDLRFNQACIRLQIVMRTWFRRKFGVSWGATNARCISAVRRPRSADASIAYLGDCRYPISLCSCASKFWRRTQPAPPEFRCDSLIKIRKADEGTTSSHRLRWPPILAAWQPSSCHPTPRHGDLAQGMAAMRSKCATSVRNFPISTSGFSPGCIRLNNFRISASP